MTSHRSILITGGAGFVGSSISIALKEDLENTRVIALDNLRRRGSELNLDRLRSYGVEFQHGDIRNKEDLKDIPSFDLILDCSAEASVHAGYNSDPSYVLNTNLVGTINCLQTARRHDADIIFLSTSRVYPIAKLQSLPVEIIEKRFSISRSSSGPGWSYSGISTDFPTDGFRSLYGATKLASELLLLEYAELYDLRVIINRCGVLSGPWQMGRIDQGFFSLWAAMHKFGGQLKYIGFGGNGHQVRDVLHVSDLYALLRRQMITFEKTKNSTFNVGGGYARSISLAELSDLCKERTNKTIKILSDPKTTKADIPYYVTDNSLVNGVFDWQPKKSLNVILDDIMNWLTEYENLLRPIFIKNIL